MKCVFLLLGNPLKSSTFFNMRNDFRGWRPKPERSHIFHFWTYSETNTDKILRKKRFSLSYKVTHFCREGTLYFGNTEGFSDRRGDVGGVYRRAYSVELVF